MDREEIIAAVAEYFNIEKDEEGNYDTDSYDWQAGCSIGGSSSKWLSLAEVVDCIEDIVSTYF